MIDVTRFDHCKTKPMSFIKSVGCSIFFAVFFAGLAGLAAITIVGMVFAPVFLIAAVVVPVFAFFGKDAECPKCFEKIMVFSFLGKMTKCKCCKEKLKIVNGKNKEQYLIAINSRRM